MLEKLKKYKYVPFGYNVNIKKVPINTMFISNSNAEIFNSIYQWTINTCKNNIKRTRKGYVSNNRNNLLPPMYEVARNNTWIGLTIVLYEGVWRFQLRFEKEEKNGKQQYGGQSFFAFKNELKKYKIDLENYKITNGKEIKEQIEKPLICLSSNMVRDMIFENAHHIDFHSSFPAGLANTHPEFAPVLNEIYEKRKMNPIYKAILNHSIGYMQSIDCCNAQWAHLSRDAINDNNKRIKEMAETLKKGGRLILAYNTDGIWYVGDLFHGIGEGPGLGQWENDHSNCKIRFKSGGSYEFIENNIYYPVVRGRTTLEDPKYVHYKPRELWEWGDIYNEAAEPIVYIWINEYGIKQIKYGDKDNENKLWFVI